MTPRVRRGLRECWYELSSGRWRLFDAHVFHLRGRDHPGVHHLLYLGNQPTQILRGIHNRDDDGLILLDKVMTMDLRRLTVSFEAAKYGGPSDLQFLAAIHDRFVQGFPVVLVALAKMQAEEFGFLSCSHAKAPRRARFEPGESRPHPKGR